MKFAAIARTAERFAIDNSPAILTGIGVAGAIATAYLTGRASYKAAEWISDENDRRRNADKSPGPMMTKEKIRYTWTLYIPPVITGALTITAIIGANRIGTRRAAAMAAAFSVSQRAFDEYKDKVVEKFGTAKEQHVRDEIAQDQVSRRPPVDSQVIISSGSVLTCETWTGRYFLSDMETLKQAQNTINYKVNNNFHASLGDFYDLVGLPQTDQSELLGWNVEKLLEISFSSVLANGKPCLAITYEVYPIFDYDKYGK